MGCILQEEFYTRNYKPRSRFGGAGPGPERAATTKRIDPAAIKEVWDDFGDLMQRLKQRHSPEEARSFHTAAKEWSEKFRKATFDEDVIPYIHALVYHVPEALEKFKFLPDIGVTQLERKN
ncbi:uncharacterized protein [Littorina saxatilis]|uniref:uncharacterized protein n=1 Tax=Littorina saxatilis TaxID=31220 RepID=UPI0038B561E3